MTKTCAAFQFSAESLDVPGLRVFFWTFTFRELFDDWLQFDAFHRFIWYLKREYPSFAGVRVSELHKTHGVHFHMLINNYMDVNRVRELGKSCGIGRIHATIAGKGSVPYLSKYLSKHRDGAFTKTGRRARRWACIGKIPHRCRVSDVVNDSPMWKYRREHNMPFTRYRHEALLLDCWAQGEASFRLGYEAACRGDGESLFLIARSVWHEVSEGRVSGVPYLHERADKHFRHMEYMANNPF